MTKQTMTTEALIELQRSITPGHWSWMGTKSDASSRVYLSAGVGHYAAWHSLTDPEESANARAIALVPELIAEVIRLREENATLSRKPSLTS